jgi:hypothetical protein
METLKAYIVPYIPYILAFVVYYFVVGAIHALVNWLSGANFPTKWPRLSLFLKSTGLDYVGLLNSIAGQIPKPPVPQVLPTLPALVTLPPITDTEKK